MKCSFLLALLVWCSLPLASQQPIAADQVPAAVLMSFKMNFPKADRIRWEVQLDSTYGVFFSEGKGGRSFAKYTSKGEWMMNCKNLPYSTLPQPVKQAALQFEGFEPMFVKQIDTLGTDPAYELVLLKGNEFYIIRCSPVGEILRNAGKQILANKF